MNNLAVNTLSVNLQGFPIDLGNIFDNTSSIPAKIGQIQVCILRNCA